MTVTIKVYKRSNGMISDIAYHTKTFESTDIMSDILEWAQTYDKKIEIDDLMITEAKIQ